MDRRKKKTRDAIFLAFSNLLKRRRYEKITVQDIIDEADICRSSFYAHFETKDELVNAICSDIFLHIIEHQVCQYSEGHDDELTTISHILWHIRDKAELTNGLLAGESGEIFTGYLRTYLIDLFKTLDAQNANMANCDLYLRLRAATFIEAVRWWAENDFSAPAEDVAKMICAENPIKVEK